jgi:hypothetical protein
MLPLRAMAARGREPARETRTRNHAWGVPPRCRQGRAAEADGVLSDGTPFFGQIGEIAYDADEDKIQCHLCGDWFRWVGGFHLKYRHPDWTIAEYRQAFNLNQSQVTMAAGSRQLLRTIAIDRLTAGQIGSPLGNGRGLQRGPWRSLVDRRPDLAGELHPTRNGNQQPERLGVVLGAGVVALPAMRGRMADESYGPQRSGWWLSRLRAARRCRGTSARPTDAPTRTDARGAATGSRRRAASHPERWD